MALELTEEQVKAGWTVQKLGDIARVVTGGTPSKSNPEYWGEEVPFLTPSDQQFGVRLSATERFLSEEGAEGFAKKMVPAGAAALTCIGATIGKISWTKEPTVTNQQINSVIAKTDTNGLYLYYKLSTCRDALISMASGSATPIVSKKLLESLEVQIPPRVQQDKIAEVLGSLDDKIEANKALNTNLRELFKLRFSSLVKESSREVMLTDMAEFINGKAFTKGASGTGRIVIRIAELNGGPGASTVYNEIDVDSKHEANPGDILMSWSGSLGVFLWSREQAIINQHIFKVIPKPGFSKAVIFCALENVIDDFRSIALEKATTMGHIKRGDLEKTVRIPTYNADLEVILNQICVLEQENLALADTRDLLIRKLIK